MVFSGYYIISSAAITPSIFSALANSRGVALLSIADLTAALSAAFVMEIPYVVLCKEDCAGLCPMCGENLNHVDCGHAEQLAAQAEADRIASSPFAKLRDLYPADEDE